MIKTYHLIIVPGLGGENPLVRKTVETITKSWEQFGFVTHVYVIPWNNKEPFQPKFKKFLKFVDTHTTPQNLVSLVGISAGGSAALNTFFERSEKIYKVVNICGRLRKGKNVSPTLEIAAAASPSFKESVLLFEKQEPHLSKKQRQKVLTIRGLWDETVPVSTTPLSGATNIQINSVLHLLNIGAAMIMYRGKIIEFLRNY